MQKNNDSLPLYARLLTMHRVRGAGRRPSMHRVRGAGQWPSMHRARGAGRRLSMHRARGAHSVCSMHRARGLRFFTGALTVFVLVCALCGCSSVPKRAGSISAVQSQTQTQNPFGADVPFTPKPNIPSYTLNCIEEKSEFLETSIAYPEFAEDARLNAHIQSIIQKHTARLDGIKESWNEHAAIFRQTAQHEAVLLPYRFTIETEPIYVTKNLVSMLFTVYSYEGGAHGMCVLDSLTYDCAQNRVLSVLDVCGCSSEELSAYCYKELCAALCPNGEPSDWIKSGTEPTPQNFSHFTYDGKTVTVCFEPYQVAAWSYGIQSVSFEPKR